MGAVLFAYAVGVTLIADSTLTAPVWAQWVNALLGVWFVFAASLAGYQRTREHD